MTVISLKQVRRMLTGKKNEVGYAHTHKYMNNISLLFAVFTYITVLNNAWTSITIYEKVFTIS